MTTPYFFIFLYFIIVFKLISPYSSVMFVFYYRLISLEDFFRIKIMFGLHKCFGYIGNLSLRNIFFLYFKLCMDHENQKLLRSELLTKCKCLSATKVPYSYSCQTFLFKFSISIFSMDVNFCTFK